MACDWYTMDYGESTIKTPIYRAPIYHKPRFTAAISFPQIGLNMHIAYCEQAKPRFTGNPDLPRIFPFPKTCGKSGFYCIIVNVNSILYTIIY